MVKKRIFPGACYGLDQTERTGHLVRDYRILYAAAGFPSEAETALNEMARGVEWKSDGEPEVYPPCFALWPTGDGVLAIRLRDVGRDDQGRPHVIRIEAAYINDRVILDDPGRLAGFLDNSAWPPSGWDWKENPAIEVCSEKQAKCKSNNELADFLRGSSLCPCLLLADRHLKYDEQRYEGVFSVDGLVAISIRSPRDGDHVMNGPKTKVASVSKESIDGPPRRSTLMQGRRHYMPWVILSVFILSSVIWVWSLKLQIHDLRSKNGGLQSQIRELESKNSNLNSKNESLRSETEKHKNDVKRLMQDLKDAQEDNDILASKSLSHK